MQDRDPDSRPRGARSAVAIDVGEAEDGTLTYSVAQPPEALPPVRPRDLELAWDRARAAALAARFGAPRRFRFRRPDGDVTDLALTDRDARCWAASLDTEDSIATVTGLSLCLRLLALVDLLTRARWAADLVRIGREGAEIDANLWHLAATAPLTREARFDETFLRGQIARHRALPSPVFPLGPGASA
jgi:hypothetical protein